jgi:hypothetical protein
MTCTRKGLQLQVNNTLKERDNRDRIGVEGVRASPEKKSDLLQTEKDRNNYVKRTHRSCAATVSQLKICHFLGETFNGFEVL